MAYTHALHTACSRFGYEPGGGWAQSSNAEQEEPEAGQLLVVKIVAHLSFLKVQYVHELLPSKKFSDLA